MIRESFINQFNWVNYKTKSLSSEHIGWLQSFGKQNNWNEFVNHFDIVCRTYASAKIQNNLNLLVLFLSSCFLEITEIPLTKVRLCTSSLESLQTVKDKYNPVTMEDQTGFDMKTINGGIKNDGSGFGKNNGFGGFSF